MFRGSFLTVLWVGPVQREDGLDVFPAVSLAALRWQLYFLRALNELGYRVKCVSYLPDRIFPFGKIIPKYNKKIDNLNVNQISYINLPFLREITKERNLFFLSRTMEVPDLFFTYNSYKFNTKIGKFLQDKGAVWVNIVADNDESIFADGNLFLSEYAFKKSRSAKKIYFYPPPYTLSNLEETRLNAHSENHSDFDKKKEVKLLSYFGALSEHSGIAEWLKWYGTLDKSIQEKYSVQVYGRGPLESEVRHLASKNKNIRYGGFLNEQQLREEKINSDILLNPRPDSAESLLNFPSKLQYYLPFQKPIISSYSESLPLEFRKFLFTYRNFDEAERLLRRFSSNDSDLLVEEKLKLMRVYCDNHSWKKSVSAVIDFFLDCQGHAS